MSNHHSTGILLWGEHKFAGLWFQKIGQRSDFDYLISKNKIYESEDLK